MKIIGIIAEYNPFHNGHAYQIKELKKKEKADYIIAVMSGDYIQRGGPAVIDKYARTKMALQGGADLVVMLPASISLASAEQFALGGVSILSSLGVDAFSYGCENPDYHQLKGFASFFHSEADAYKELLSLQLRNGLTFPAARQAAFHDYQLSLNENTDTLLLQFQGEQPQSSFLNSPNNILGIEYEKAVLKLQSNIQTLPIQRIGSDYHDTTLNHKLSAATAIRNALFHSDSSIFNYIPEHSHQHLLEELDLSGPINEDHFSVIMEYELHRYQEDGYSQFLDCNEDLSNRIRNQLSNFTSFSQFAALIKTKGYTLTRVQRVLMHILLDMQKQDNQLFEKYNYAPYARILGFRSEARPLLSELHNKSSIPIITSVSDAIKEIEDSRLHFFKQDIAASNLYHLVVKQQFGRLIANDFSHPLIILD